MSGRPVELFVPPEIVERPSAESFPVPVLPQAAVGLGSSVWVGMAAVDHSGRLRDKALLALLGWQPGDRLAAEVCARIVVVHRAGDGAFAIDSRQQVFLPAGMRALFGIGTGDRVVLVAAPESGVLIVYPVAVVAELLAEHYASYAGDADFD